MTLHQHLKTVDDLDNTHSEDDTEEGVVEEQDDTERNDQDWIPEGWNMAVVIPQKK